MTKLSYEMYTMPAANLGEENCQPDFKNVEYIHAGYTCTENVTEEEMTHIGKGMINTILPYTILDNYDRSRQLKQFPAVILENDYLRAVFLPSLGGRLWSLYDKKKNKELLYVNSVFQPANLAIRNAWFSGGVEWNVGIKGHNPLTCDPLFAEYAESEKGEPVLRMYEYERIRDIVYSIEAYMPDDQPVLYVRDTIENTSDKDKYTYWWSNIAVPETDDTRVIVPADDAFICFYNEGSYVLDKVTVPEKDGIDYSYPYNSKRSQDFFYKIPPKRSKWIASLEKDGKGLIHFSQHKLIGRKMFLWGQGSGGRHWGEFLSNPGESYIEIQAGLAHTQLEHIPLPAGETWQWIEAYCPSECTPQQVCADWDIAQSYVEQNISKYVDLDNIDASIENIFPKKLVNRKMLHNGAGWGYVEQEKRKLFNQPRLSNIYDFPVTTITKKEAQWLELIRNGKLTCNDDTKPPISYLVSPELIPVLEKSADNWYAYLQLGVMYYANERFEDAKNALQKSNELKETPWALRNLAMIAKNDDKDLESATQLILKAISLNNTERGLVVNCAQVLIAAKKYEKWLEIYEDLNNVLKSDGRLMFYCALSYLRLGNATKAAEIITPDFVMCDIKEGEISISHLWYEIYEELTGDKKYSLPFSLDFRMHE